MMQDAAPGKITHCQICSGDIEGIVSFGHQPPVQSYLRKEQLGMPEITYPLNWYWCPSCWLVQLDYIAEPGIVFPKDYPYQSAMTRNLRENFADLAEKVSQRFPMQKNDLVIDIGSNDGTLLSNFRQRGFRVLGVEPTGIASIAVRNEIPTVNRFFNEAVADEILSVHGKARCITAANVFAHVNALFSMMRGIGKLLMDDGVFVSESHYLLDLVGKSEYDTIYHEHLRFYSLKPLIRLHEMAGFSVIDAERIPTHGGSVRVYAVKSGSQLAGSCSRRLQELLEEEEKAGLYSKETYRQLGKRIIEVKHRLLALLLSLKNQGKSIAAIGAPARSSMLLGYCRIDPSVVEYTAEPSDSLKIGLFTPGTHIPVVDERRVFEKQPDYLLILSWHIGEELMKKLRRLGYKGKFIMPLPEPEIADA